MIKVTKVENGWVRGIQGADAKIVSFKGIPFAAPPVGDLRWRAPQPPADWEGIRDCLEFAPISMQEIPGVDQTQLYTYEFNPDPEIPMSEDCLYLNVWTPAATPEERLPVFVWYFGGGLQVGNTAEMEFNGERLARRGIVVVSVNYRLNAFGFLAHPELTAEHPEAPANFGNLDQQFGTQWVKRNIAAFGGDPEQITIGGQSSGGDSVVTQLASPLNEGLFQRAIIQSGVWTSPVGRFQPPDAPRYLERSLSAMEQAGVEFFELMGVRTLAEARALPAEFVRDKALEFHAMWTTVPDGRFVPDNPPELVLRNKRHMVPLLMGNTTVEFPSAPKADSFEALEALAQNVFGERAGEYLDLIRGRTLEETLEKATFSSVELAIRVISEQTAVAGGPNCYYYQFGTDVPGWDHPGPFHSVDLWFFFDSLGACWRPFVGKHYDLARQMANYWANFVKTGDPNGKDVDGSEMPYWPPYAESKHPIRFMEAVEEGVPDSESKLMRFLVDAVKEKHPC